MVVHRGLHDNPLPPGHKSNYVFKVQEYVGGDPNADGPGLNWTVEHGPATWDEWTDCELFGAIEPDLPPVRFETDPDGDVVDVIAPVMADSWLLRVSLRRDGDDLVPVAIDLRPRPGSTINARALRTLGFGSVQRAATQVLLHDPLIARHLGERWAQPVQYPGRAGRKEDFYAGWARRYVEALDAAPRRPIAHLLEQAAERGEHMTRGEVASRLTEARRRGLLTESPPGQPGGELTDKARRLLGIEEEGNAQ